MKPVVRLNEYFLQKALKPQQICNPNEIQALQKSLLDMERCSLCKQQYMLSKIDRIPRILISCGHTLCGGCLKQFCSDNKIRCPLCLKLTKQLPNIEFLPINHTIYTNKAKQLGEPEIPQKFLCTNFTMSSRQRLHDKNPPSTDEQTGLSLCVFHPEKIQHYFCIHHQVPGCRQCMQVRHKRPQCKILNLYDLQDGNKNQRDKQK